MKFQSISFVQLAELKLLNQLLKVAKKNFFGILKMLDNDPNTH